MAQGREPVATAIASPCSSAQRSSALSRRLRVRRGPDSGQHGWQIRRHRMVGKAQHQIARRGQQGFSLGIVLALTGVDATIQLDDETQIGTAEVGNEWANRMLTPELQTGEAATAQLLPEHDLGRSLLLAQVAGSRDVVAMPETTVGHVGSVARHGCRGKKLRDLNWCRNRQLSQPRPILIPNPSLPLAPLRWEKGAWWPA